MKKVSTKDFSKKVQAACNAFQRRNIHPKQVIEDVIGHCCLLLMNDQFITRVFPRTLYQFSSSFVPDFKHYKDELKAHAIVQELVMDYLTLMKESEPFTDVLGMLYDEHLGQALGQFLTPPDIADVLAALVPHKEDDFTQERSITDCCGCGAGSLLLGSLRHIYSTYGKDAIANVHVDAVDLDSNMVKMATVQIVLNSIIHQIPLCSFKISHGNAITDYTAINENKKIAFMWKPYAPSDVYFNAVAEKEMDSVLRMLQTFNEVSEQIKSRTTEQEREAA